MSSQAFSTPRVFLPFIIQWRHLCKCSQENCYAGHRCVLFCGVLKLEDGTLICVAKMHQDHSLSKSEEVLQKCAFTDELFAF